MIVDSGTALSINNPCPLGGRGSFFHHLYILRAIALSVTGCYDIIEGTIMSDNLNEYMPNIDDTINSVSNVIFERHFDNNGDNIILNNNHIQIIKGAYNTILNNLDYYVVSVNNDTHSIYDVNDNLCNLIDEADDFTHLITHHTILHIYHAVVNNYSDNI